MTGTIINVAAIILGGGLGLLFGARFPERVRQTVLAGMGLFVAILGIQMTFDTQQPLVIAGSLLIGGLLGEWWQIEDRLRKLGAGLEERLTGKKSSQLTPVENPESNHGSRFVRGFLAASLVFAIGPIAILGSIQDGLTGDYSLLAIKSILDAFGALAFASSLGVGVLFSSLVILVYQGGISLLANQAQAILTTPMTNEMTATGGVLLLGLAISNLLEIKPIRVGNFLPALVVAPIIVAILSALGIPLN
ncbi:MAG TPA: DUF554 domain-containing protein [Anaerolineales bacterium]|nr:DUF554 domain-containing protein [Anaerolineales bacterium]